VVQTEPWVRGDTSKADFKPATLETGYVLRVPPFVEEGELITIDTRTGEFSKGSRNKVNHGLELLRRPSPSKRRGLCGLIYKSSECRL